MSKPDKLPDFREQITKVMDRNKFAKLVSERFDAQREEKEAKAKKEEIDMELHILMTQLKVKGCTYFDKRVQILGGTNTRINGQTLTELGVPVETIISATETTSYTYISVREFDPEADERDGRTGRVQQPANSKSKGKKG